MKLIEHDIRILIAEDDEDDLFLFRELISEWKNWDYYARRSNKAAVIVDSARTREDIFQNLLEMEWVGSAKRNPGKELHDSRNHIDRTGGSGGRC